MCVVFSVVCCVLAVCWGHLTKDIPHQRHTTTSRVPFGWVALSGAGGGRSDPAQARGPDLLTFTDYGVVGGSAGPPTAGGTPGGGAACSGGPGTLESPSWWDPAVFTVTFLAFLALQTAGVGFVDGNAICQAHSLGVQIKWIVFYQVSPAWLPRPNGSAPYLACYSQSL